MNLYEGVAFKGTFRRYQQRVLDNANQYMVEGKLNIVAAPGSGKTVLGLELIRSLGEPCLIISPTEATIAHWGKRLRQYFLAEDRRYEELFSTNPEAVKVINAMTYEDLEEWVEKYALDGEKKSIKLRRTIRERGIKTICLDEPHHLKEEYVSALGKMQELLEQDVKIISLTTTLPGAHEEAERQRFFEVCGEIDVQIIETELVAEKVFCPHRDYRHFSVPSEEEITLLREQMERIQSALEEIGGLECVKVSIRIVNQWDGVWTYRYSHHRDAVKMRAPQAYIPLVQLMQYYGLTLSGHKIKMLTGKKKLPPVQLKDLQIALQFLTEHSEILEEHRKSILQVLTKYNLYEKNSVRLMPRELMQKAVMASEGKIHSIREIVSREYQTLRKDLRLLVFTEGMDTTSIFEAIRGQEIEVKIGIFTEELLILPDFPELQGTMMRMEPLGDTGYVKVEFFGEALDASDMVKDMLREGKLQVLIGNQALLNGDWEESTINALILPECFNDLSNSNAMRGIVLRRSADNPEKTVNNWHLTTLLPRDMAGYMGYPSTVDTKEELQHINEETLKDAADRVNMRKIWKEKTRWLQKNTPGKIR